MSSDSVFVADVPHSTRGASSADRWMNCAGSLNLASQVVARGGDLMSSGRAAAEGTAAHTVAAAALEDGSDAWEFFEMEIVVSGMRFEVDEEMVEGVQLYLDTVRGMVSEYEAEGHDVDLHVEHRLSSVTDEDAFGTADALIHVHGVCIIVIDFKYGRNIVCEPDSAQTKYYGYLGIEQYCSDEVPVRLAIVQPRAYHPEGPVRSFDTTSTEIERWWFDELLPAIHETRRPEATLHIGSWCRFCPAREHCPAMQGETFDFPIGMDPSFLTGDEIGRLLTKANAVAAYANNTLAPLAFQRAMEGDRVTGFKLVNKLARRVYRKGAEEAARDDVGEAAFSTPDLLSPHKMEKIGPEAKKFVSKWAYMPSTGLTLAPESDKRIAAKSLIEEYMDVLDN